MSGLNDYTFNFFLNCFNYLEVIIYMTYRALGGNYMDV